MLEDSSITNNIDNVVIVSDLCSDGETTLEQLSHDFDTMVAKAKSIANTIKISSVIPSTDDLNERCERFNHWMRDKCREATVTFVDNDINFVFRDGSRDRSAFQGDGTRLSHSGTSRLLSNLLLVLDRSDNRERSRPHTTPSSDRYDKRRKQQRKPQETTRAQDSRNDSYRHIHGQCMTCGETNHVTPKCKHERQVQCFTCGALGHKNKHHGRFDG